MSDRDWYHTRAVELWNKENIGQSKSQGRNTLLDVYSWTPERVATLTRLWNEGWSASQIAAQLGGLTRNAVIGKVHRALLPGRAKPASNCATKSAKRGFNIPADMQIERRRQATRAQHMTHAPKMRKPKAPQPSRPPLTDIAAPVTLGVSLLALTDTSCRWPYGHPGSDGFGFCGHRIFEQLSYCEYHSRIAYVAYERRSSAA